MIPVCQTPPQLHPGGVSPPAVLVMSGSGRKLPRRVCLDCATRWAREAVADAMTANTVDGPSVHTITMSPVV